MEKDSWHSLECFKPDYVLYESKDGPCHSFEEDETISVGLKPINKYSVHNKPL